MEANKAGFWKTPKCTAEPDLDPVLLASSPDPLSWTVMVYSWAKRREFGIVRCSEKRVHTEEGGLAPRGDLRVEKSRGLRHAAFGTFFYSPYYELVAL